MGDPYFVEGPEIRHYDYNGVSLDIEVNKDVFPPPEEPPITMRNMRVEEGETVIDIGTGSGILAAYAAKLGGIVSATDLDWGVLGQARDNASRNGVHLDYGVGKYFAGFSGKFDVIVANLAQTIMPPGSLEALGHRLYASVDGGPMGNRNVLGLLSLAHSHMDGDSRMYINVYSLSDYNTTINTMLEHYEAKLIGEQEEPVKGFVSRDMHFYIPLLHEGIVSIFEQKGQWMAQQRLYELKLK